MFGRIIAFLGLTATSGCLNRITTGASRTIELDGETAGWKGQIPNTIEGKTNPTLSLDPGPNYYTLSWENVDGEEHRFIIGDGTGNQLEASDTSRKAGETVTLTFTASEEMAEYYCEHHPNTMRGDITIDG